MPLKNCLPFSFLKEISETLYCSQKSFLKLIRNFSVLKNRMMPSFEKPHIILNLKGNFQNVPKKFLFTALI